MAIEKILVPVDGSDHSRRAAQFAADLALHYGAEVILLHAVHGGTPHVPADVASYERFEHIELTQRDFLEASGEHLVQQAEKVLRDAGVPDVRTIVEVGHPAEVIEQIARGGLGDDDVIVMGRRGLGGLSSLMLGSVSKRIGHDLDRTLVTVK